MGSLVAAAESTLACGQWRVAGGPHISRVCERIWPRPNPHLKSRFAKGPLEIHASAPAVHAGRGAKKARGEES